jgi:hypothetical protein|nr:hypothetical protein [uncultured Lachnoanaerobaculum sp.]
MLIFFSLVFFVYCCLILALLQAKDLHDFGRIFTANFKKIFLKILKLSGKIYKMVVTECEKPLGNYQNIANVPKYQILYLTQILSDFFKSPTFFDQEIIASSGQRKVIFRSAGLIDNDYTAALVALVLHNYFFEKFELSINFDVSFDNAGAIIVVIM